MFLTLHGVRSELEDLGRRVERLRGKRLIEREGCLERCEGEAIAYIMQPR
jgi:hypothetical protein